VTPLAVLKKEKFVRSNLLTTLQTKSMSFHCHW